MRLVIFLVLAFGVLILGTKLLIFIYDHGNVLSIWESPFWKTWRVPVITVAVLIGIALLVTVAVRSEKKHDAAERAFVLGQGWQYSVLNDDPEGLMPKLLSSLKKATPGRTYNLTTVIRAPYGGCEFLMFNCRYREKGGKDYKDGSGCFVQSESLNHLTSQVNIVPKTVLDNALMFNKVDIGDFEFARKYIISAEEPSAAREAAGESLRIVLINHANAADYNANYEINLGPGGAVILRWAHIVPEEWLSVLELARSIEATIR